MTYTEEIFASECPYDNMYQGIASRYLFVCSAGMLRSPTAAAVAVKMGYNARSCGSASYALIPLSVNLINWANRIYFVEENNFYQALETFEHNQEIVDILHAKSEIWEIEDYYDYNDLGLTNKIAALLQ